MPGRDRTLRLVMVVLLMAPLGLGCDTGRVDPPDAAPALSCLACRDPGIRCGELGWECLDGTECDFPAPAAGTDAAPVICPTEK